MSLLLDKDVLVKSVHPFVLTRFKSGEEGAAPKPKSEGDNKAADAPVDDGEDSYYEEEDGRWLCDGSRIFKCGCKSGQTDFDLHVGTEGWTSSQEEEDFDLCDMCIRWALHCEKNRLELELTDEFLAEIRNKGLAVGG